MQKDVIYKIKCDCFNELNSISAFILPQSENISATNGRMVAPFCMSGLLKYINNKKLIFCVSYHCHVIEILVDELL